eukprot:gene9710-7578_t
MLCNVTKLFGSLCMDLPEAVPECGIATEAAIAKGSSAAACWLLYSYNLPSTANVLATCSGAAACADPFKSLGQSCASSFQSTCEGWRTFCNTDASTGAGFSSFGLKAPGLCMNPTNRTACQGYTYPEDLARAHIASLCGFSSTLPECSIWGACEEGDMSGYTCDPFSVLAALCWATGGGGAGGAVACQPYAKLCGGVGSKVAQCALALPKALSTPPVMPRTSVLSSSCWSASANETVPNYTSRCFRCTSPSTCIDPLSAASLACQPGSSSGTDIPACAAISTWCTASASASTVTSATRDGCDQMGGFMDGCDTCPTTNNCDDPWASLSIGCLQMDLGSSVSASALWRTFSAQLPPLLVELPWLSLHRHFLCVSR